MHRDNRAKKITRIILGTVGYVLLVAIVGALGYLVFRLGLYYYHVISEVVTGSSLQDFGDYVMLFVLGLGIAIGLYIGIGCLIRWAWDK